MRNVHVIGTAVTRFGRHLDRGLRSLAEEATSKALADAGASTADVESVFLSNAAAGFITRQEMVRGQAAFRTSGLPTRSRSWPRYCSPQSRTARGEEKSAVALAAERAYELAGIGPRDIDVLELHDAAVPGRARRPGGSRAVFT